MERPLATATSQYANSSKPTDNAQPVTRCRIDNAIVYCQRYTVRNGDSGRLRVVELSKLTPKVRNRCSGRSSPNRRSAWDRGRRGHRARAEARPCAAPAPELRTRHGRPTHSYLWSAAIRTMIACHATYSERKCARSTFEAEPRLVSLSRGLTSDLANG